MWIIGKGKKNLFIVEWEVKKMYKCQIYHVTVTFGWQFKKISSLVSQRAFRIRPKSQPQPAPSHLFAFAQIKFSFSIFFLSFAFSSPYDLCKDVIQGCDGFSLYHCCWWKWKIHAYFGMCSILSFWLLYKHNPHNQHTIISLMLTPSKYCPQHRLPHTMIEIKNKNPRWAKTTTNDKKKWKKKKEWLNKKTSSSKITIVLYSNGRIW